MPTFAECLETAVADGLDPVRADILKKKYSELRKFLNESEAAGEAFESTAKEILEKKRIKLKQAAVEELLNTALDTAPNKVQAAYALIDSVGLDTETLKHLNTLGIFSTVQKMKRIRGAAHANMDEVMTKLRRNLLGKSKDERLLTDLVQEAVERGSTGNANAQALAESWLKTADYLRTRYNAAGGHIRKLDGWAIPHTHDSLRVRQAEYQGWRDFIWNRLDRERMSPVPGRAMTDSELEDALKQIHQTISAEGMNKVTPSGAAAGLSVANRRADHRILHFKTAEDWLSYQKDFGEGDAYSSMMAYIDGMSRDIAAMETLGPNPQATVRMLKQRLKVDMSTASEQTKGVLDWFGGTQRARLEAASNHIETLYEHYTGAANAPGSGRWGRAFSNVRQLLVSAQLGSAAISAVTDVNFVRKTANFNGLSEARALGRALKLLNPANDADRKLAIRLGLIADEYATIASAQMRYVGEIAGGEFTKRLSDGVLRISGLSPWTQAHRWAFGMEFMGTLSDNTGKSYGRLNKNLRNALDRYGISSDEWDTIRKTKKYTYEGASFLRPDDMASELHATKLLNMIQSETEYAVPSASLRGRAKLSARTKPGTIPGELLRSSLMYKNFATTMFMTHVMRGVRDTQTRGKGGYLGGLIMSTTLMGAFALQMKEIANGRDPKPMDSKAFWGAAMLQGGGVGIFGDFLFADTNRFGASLGDMTSGPVVGFAGDAKNLTEAMVETAAAAIQGERVDLPPEVTRFLKRYTPGASLWYAKLFYERMVLDQMQLWLDRDARSNMRKFEKRRQTQHGQKHWWSRGDMLPDRGPEIEKATGDLL